MGTDNTVEKVKGMAKEIAGEAVGNENLEREGEQQQKKAQSEEEAERYEDKAAEKRQEAAGHQGAEKSESMKK